MTWQKTAHGSFTFRDHEVSFDGEDMEVREDMPGYYGGSSTTFVPFTVIVELLAQYGYSVRWVEPNP